MKKLKLKEWIPKEEAEQEHIFTWATMMEGREPRLRLLSASMNGILTTAQFGAKLKRLGRKAGFPDLFLPVRGYASCPGLFIELKRRVGGKVSPEQIAWHDLLEDQGYTVKTCHGAQSAIDTIKQYLDMEES